MPRHIKATGAYQYYSIEVKGNAVVVAVQWLQRRSHQPNRVSCWAEALRSRVRGGATHPTLWQLGNGALAIGSCFPLHPPEFVLELLWLRAFPLHLQQCGLPGIVMEWLAGASSAVVGRLQLPWFSLYREGKCEYKLHDPIASSSVYLLFQ